MQIRKSDFELVRLCIVSYIAYPSSAMTVCSHIGNVARKNSKISFLLEYAFDGTGTTEFVCPLISLSRIYWPASERDAIAKLLSHGSNAF